MLMYYYVNIEKLKRKCYRLFNEVALRRLVDLCIIYCVSDMFNVPNRCHVL